jgi:hypothetical protein
MLRSRPALSAFAIGHFRSGPSPSLERERGCPKTCSDIAYDCPKPNSLSFSRGLIRRSDTHCDSEMSKRCRNGLSLRHCMSERAQTWFGAMVLPVAPTPPLCQPSGRAGAGSVALRAAHLLVAPAIQGSPSCVHARRVRNDPSGAATAGLDWTSSAPIGALSRPANDAHTGRSRPQSQGGSQPPRSNGQAFHEARNPVTVAGRRCCRASGRVRPRWDRAFPCCSPLASVVGAGPSAVPSGEHPPAGGPALLG